MAKNQQRKTILDDEDDFFDFQPPMREGEASPIIELAVGDGFRETDPMRIFSGIPKVIEVNDFTDKSVKAFQKTMAAAMRADQQVIPIIIDSYGGEVFPLFRMLDLIEVAKKRGFAVATIATGKAMSCGSCLLGAGTEGMRYATADAIIMVHEASTWAEGKVTDVEADVAVAKAQDKRLYALLDAACKKEAGYWENRIHDNGHANLYLTAQEAKKVGLISAIGLPVFRISASVQCEWVHP